MASSSESFSAPAPRFSGAARAGVIHQNAADHLRGDAEEMGAVLPPDVVLADQLQIGLVNQGGALQGVARPLLPQVAAGQAAQFVVDQGGEFLQGLPVPVAPVSQQTGDLVLGGHLTELSHSREPFRAAPTRS